LPTRSNADSFTLRTALAAADAPATGDYKSAWSYPTKTSKDALVLKTTIMVDGKEVTKEVQVKGIKAYVEPPQGNKTIKD
jgi:hypothetical protein